MLGPITTTDDDYVSKLSVRKPYVMINVKSMGRTENLILDDWIRNKYSSEKNYSEAPGTTSFKSKMRDYTHRLARKPGQPLDASLKSVFASLDLNILEVVHKTNTDGNGMLTTATNHVPMWSFRTINIEGFNQGKVWF